MRIIEIWRYPVKSMQGERLAEAEVGLLGIDGDRGWALRDLTTGLTLTARREPSLLYATGRIVDGRAVVRMPDGIETDSDDVLSAWVGRDVALVAAGDSDATYEIATDAEREADSPWVTWSGPAGAFHDSARARISVIGEATLRTWPVRRFRPNLLVSGGEEDALVGSAVRVGDSVQLDVIQQIDRCVMITRPQPATVDASDIERDLGVLRTVNRERAACLGVGALISTGGVVRVGDEISAAPIDG